MFGMFKRKDKKKGQPATETTVTKKPADRTATSVPDLQKVLLARKKRRKEMLDDMM